MGIDLGTSSVKTLIMDPAGQLMALSQRDYVFDIPQPGWAEQDPEIWWLAAVQTIREALERARIAPQDLAGVGFSGQMHGLVTLDRQGSPLRPAIIWCDQRAAGEVWTIEQQIGLKQLGEWTCNRVAAGFQTASLLWLKTHEPLIYDQTAMILTPKDYLRFRLTGELSTDITDAAGTLALDVRQGRWSTELLAALGLRFDFYPPIALPESPAGQILPSAAEQTGLAPGTAVFHGGADQVMQAIGNGIILPGQVSATIGTGGQIFAPLADAWYDPGLRTHTFNNYDGRSWYLMGASLSAGLALRWLRGQVLNGLSYREMDQLAAGVPQGSEGLFFLPYLTGERTPHMDPQARAMFAGLTLRHGQGHLIRSVLEGVAYALRDSLDILRQLGQPVEHIIASGGGAQSPLWLQIQADVFQAEIKLSQMSEQAAVGAAIVAGVGAGLYPDYRAACQAVVRWHDVRYEPDPATAARYDQGHRIFQSLYPANRSIMAEMGRFQH
jgi:xylulokinase